MLRNADRFSDPAPVHVRHLTGQIDRQSAIDPRFRENGTCLKAGRNEPVVDEAQAQHLIRLASRRCVIAAASLEISRNVVRNIFVELRRALGNGCLFVDDGRQYLLRNINELQRVMGRLACLGNDERNAFPDNTNPVYGHHRPVRHHSTGDDPVGLDVADFSGEIGAG